MKKYTVRVYVGSMWSFLTHADHFEDYNITTCENMRQLAKRLARDGFATDDGPWIMPGAILKITAT
jgi:hypothetical protein